MQTRTPKRRILILTADAGFGHRSAARAVAQALDENWGSQCQCAIVNPVVDWPAPFFLARSQLEYDHTVQAHPGFYRLSYQASDSRLASALVESSLAVLLKKTMQAILASYRPDVVLTTFHLYNAPLQAALAHGRPPRPFFCVVTDLAEVHQLWFQPGPARLFTPTPQVRQQAIAGGFPAARVVVSGIPVAPAFARPTLPRAGLRAALGWDPGRFTLLFVGSRRIHHVYEHLLAIDRSELDLQLALVCGGNAELYRQVAARPWRLPLHLYDYVENVPELMRAADALVSKAGGLVIAEGLACGLPLLLIDQIPGQERGNARYVQQCKAGLALQTPEDMVQTLNSLLSEDGGILKQVTDNARRVGRPGAAFQIAAELWQAAQENEAC
jgi:1,2-diacylglycerol 3-beta-galactosyltransferase